MLLHGTNVKAHLALLVCAYSSALQLLQGWRGYPRMFFADELMRATTVEWARSGARATRSIRPLYLQEEEIPGRRT